MAEDLRKGCRVRLSGLNTTVLNGAEGCIVGPLDEETGRHPVKLLKPQDAVAAFPQGVKVKPVNLEKIQIVSTTSNKPSSAKKAVRQARDSPGPRATIDPSAPLDPAAWALGLKPDERAEWLVNCYRMRVDDDYAWGGGNLHGLYDPDHTDDSVLSDFLVFCKLAARNKVIPDAGWSWSKFLDKAQELLPYAYEKSDAQEQYGKENVFAAMMGGRSLRFTAEMVYGTSCMSGGMGSSPQAEEVEGEVHAAPLDELLQGQSELFADVGGVELWRRLRARFVATAPVRF